MTSPTSDRRQGLVGNTPIKAPVDCATTGNIILSGEQVIDGFQTASSRVLVKDQIDPTQNGIYDSSSGAWTRSADADGNYDLVKGSRVLVANGLQAFREFVLASANPITFGSSLLTWIVNLSTGFLSTIATAIGSSLMGFIQAGVGAVAGTVQDELRSWTRPEQFGALGNGSNDGPAIVRMMTAIANGLVPGNVLLTKQYFMAAGLYDFSATSNLRLAGPGGLVGPAVSSNAQPTALILWRGTLGSPVAISTTVAAGVRNFTCNNLFTAGDLLLISNFPVDASDAYTAGSTDGFGRTSRTYANTSTSNLRQTRRKELLHCLSATTSTVTTVNVTAYNYASTTGLQLQKVTPVSNIEIACSLTNIGASFELAKGVVVSGACVNSTIQGLTLYKPVLAPRYFEANNTDCRIDLYEGTLAPIVRGTYAGMNGPSDNGLVKLLGVIDPDVDVVGCGSYSASSFTHLVMLDSEFVESPSGYCSLPWLGGTINVSGRGIDGSLIFATCDPWAAPSGGAIFNVAGSAGDVHLKGVAGITIDGPITSAYLEGATSIEFTSPRVTPSEGSITNPRNGAQTQANSDIRGVWRTFTAAPVGATFAGVTAPTRYIQRGYDMEVQGLCSYTSSASPTASFQVTLPAVANSNMPRSPVTIGLTTGLTMTNGLAGFIEPGTSAITFVYNGNTQQNPPSGAVSVTYSAFYNVAT